MLIPKDSSPKKSAEIQENINRKWIQPEIINVTFVTGTNFANNLIQIDNYKIYGFIKCNFGAWLLGVSTPTRRLSRSLETTPTASYPIGLGPGKPRRRFWLDISDILQNIFSLLCWAWFFCFRIISSPFFV